MSPRHLGIPPLGTEASPGLFLGALFLVWLVSCVPLAFATYPPLLDYPFHLARVHVLADWSEVPWFHQAYRPGSFFLPNVGWDTLVLGMSAVLPLDVAGRVFIALVFLLILSGCAFLNWSLFRRLTLWPLVCSVLLYNWIFLLGFLSYLLGLGVMLWGVGAWVATSRCRAATQIGIGSAFGVLLFFCHLSAFGLFALGVSGYELYRSAQHRDTLLRASAATAAKLAPVFAAPVIFFFASATGQSTTAEVQWLPWAKLFAFRTLFSASWLIDVLLWAALIFMALWLKRRDIRVDRRMYLAILFLLIAFVALPESLITGWYVSTRLIIGIALMVLAASSPASGKPLSSPWITFVLASFLLYRSAVLSLTWQSHAELMAELTSAFDSLPAEAVVFSATSNDYPPAGRRDRMQPPIWHWANLAVLRRDALVPSMYAEPGQQPVRISERFEPLYDYQGTDPLSLSEHDLPGIVARISELSDSLGLDDHPVFLLILDPRDSDSGPGLDARVAAAGRRFLLLEIGSPGASAP